MPSVKLTNSVPCGKALALGCSQAYEMLDIALAGDALIGNI